MVARLTAAGTARSADDIFCALRVPTRPGFSRRLDYALTNNMLFAERSAQAKGVRDHDLVIYDFATGAAPTRYTKPSHRPLERKIPVCDEEATIVVDNSPFRAAMDAMRCASSSAANPSRPASSSAASNGVRESVYGEEDMVTSVEDEDAARLSIGAHCPPAAEKLEPPPLQGEPFCC